MKSSMVYHYTRWETNHGRGKLRKPILIRLESFGHGQSANLCAVAFPSEVRLFKHEADNRYTTIRLAFTMYSPSKRNKGIKKN